MAISTAYLPVKLSGDGVTVAFSFGFRIYANTDLKVSWILKTTGEVSAVKELSTDYTVAINANSEGGIVTFGGSDVPPSTVWVLIESIIPKTQTTNLGVDAKLSEKSIETMVDRQCRLSQQLSEAVDRSLKIPPSLASAGINMNIPIPVASKVLGFDAAGTGFALYTADSGVAAAEAEASAAEASGHADDAEAAKTGAETAQGLAEDAQTAAEAAETAAVAAQVAAENAQTIVQVVNTQTGAVATGTTVIPADDTIPQNTEGDQYMSLAITPTDANNKLKITVTLIGAVDSNGESFAVALFKDSVADALAAAPAGDVVSGGQMRTVTFSHYMTAGAATAMTFKVRAGFFSGTGTFTFNGTAGGRIFGGVMSSSITIEEIRV